LEGSDLLDRKTIFKWEAFGFFFIIIIGTLLHFCFEWSGRFPPSALFCAVNESVWEHLKLGFWPCLAFTLFEYILWGKNVNNFIVGKVLPLYIIPIAITVLFYSYTAILGRHTLPLDILIFVLSVLLAQFISYKVMTSYKDYSPLNKTALVLLAILTLAFSLLTYFPPELKPFLDPRTGKPGIPG
jgi:hypothetical protein